MLTDIFNQTIGGIVQSTTLLLTLHLQPIFTASDNFGKIFMHSKRLSCTHRNLTLAQFFTQMQIITPHTGSKLLKNRFQTDSKPNHTHRFQTFEKGWCKILRLPPGTEWSQMNLGYFGIILPFDLSEIMNTFDTTEQYLSM